MATLSRLKVNVRDRLGTRTSQRLRKSGKLPAVVYGHGEAPVHVAVEREALMHELRRGARVVEIEHEGDRRVETCLIKDVQHDYLGTGVVHVDFTRVDLTEQVAVSVPLVIKGKDRSPGAKTPGAIVDQVMLELKVRCLVTSIPQRIEVDISGLELDQSVAIKDLKLPEGVTTEQDANAVLVSIHMTAEEVVEPAAAAAEGEAAKEPEVIAEKKAEERQEAKKAEGKKQEEKKE